MLDLTSMDKKRRAPDIKSAGVTLMAGVLVAQVVKGDHRAAALVALMGALVYAYGMSWE